MCRKKQKMATFEDCEETTSLESSDQQQRAGDFICRFIFYSLNKIKNNVIHECLLLLPVNNIKPLNNLLLMTIYIEVSIIIIIVIIIGMMLINDLIF